MRTLLAAVLIAGLAGCQAQNSGGKDVKLESKEDKVSYSIGLNIGMGMKRDSIKVVPDAFLRGVMDARADSAGRLMTDKEVQETLTTFQEEMQSKKMENARLAGEKNRTEGEAFLAENGKKPGVITLPSGLQYKVTTEGNGKNPSSTSTVTTHYTGRLLDGTVFDSSIKRGQPATFRVSEVISGWSQALQMMKTGSKWELYIPSSLAYGEAGAGGVIPPNATLVFEVELISVE
jgi:FKBP-type peptidyl-prolyl cis-trans isomerase FklB